VVAVDTTRGVLLALAQALPDEGSDLVTRLEIHDGWGGAVHVRIQTQVPRSAAGRELETRLRAAVGTALGQRRHRVEMRWGPPRVT